VHGLGVGWGRVLALHDGDTTRSAGQPVGCVCVRVRVCACVCVLRLAPGLIPNRLKHSCAGAIARGECVCACV
jgi:hypothetical protein